MRVDIAVYDGLDELDALGPLEVLRGAAHLGAPIEVHLVTRSPQPVVTGAHGLAFRADGTYSPGADVLIMPGGGWMARAPQGAWAEYQRGHWVQILRRADAQDTSRLIAGVCTGSLLLAHAGLLNGRRATTHHDAWADLEATNVIPVRQRVVDEGHVLTSGGVTAGMDLALWLLERELGRDLADRIAARLEYSRFRPEV